MQNTPKIYDRLPLLPRDLDVSLAVLLVPDLILVIADYF